jgi:hypothetical protein
MANYVLLFTGGSMPETKAEQDKVLQEWGAWFGKLGSALVDGGKPFTPNAKKVEAGGKVSDGAIGTPATGYTIIKADSLNAAAEVAKGCPIFLGGGKLTVYETSDMM